MGTNYIDRILNNTIPKSYARGEDLFYDGSVIKKNFSGNSYSAIVLGRSSNYKVKITNIDRESIKATCTCPYDWGGYCKHIVAAALEFKEDLEEEDIDFKSEPSLFVDEPQGTGADSKKEEQNKPKKSSKRCSSEPFEIDLSDQKFRETYLSKLSYWNSPTVSDVSRDKDGIFAKVKDANNSATYDVFVFKKDEKFYITCSCHNKVDGVCDHANYAMQLMHANKFPFELILSMSEDEYLRKNALYFGVPEELINSKNAAIIFTNEFQAFFERKNKLKRFVSNDLLEQLDFSKKRSYKDDLERVKKMYSGDIELDRRMALVIEYSEIAIRPFCISGRIAKCGTRLGTKLRRLSTEVARQIPMSNRERAVFDFCEGFPSTDSYNYTGYLEEQYRLIGQLWDLIGEDTIVYIKKMNTGYSSTDFRKSDLEFYEVEQQTPQVKFVSKEMGSLIETRMEVRLGKEKLKNSGLDMINRFMFEYEGRLCLLADMAQISLFEEFDKYSIFSVSKENKPFLIQNVLSSLSKRFEVSCNFVDNVKGEFASNTLFIDEAETHLIFTPIVEYQDGMSVNLLEPTNSFWIDDRCVKRDRRAEKEFRKLIDGGREEWKEQSKNYSSLAVHMQEVFEDDWFYKFFDEVKQAGVVIKGFSKLKKFRYSPYQAEVNYQVESNEDWFEANMSVAFGDMVITINDLKKHLKAGGKYIELSDGTLGVVPDKWIARLRELMRVGTIKDDKVRISKLKFSVVDELFDGIDHSELAEELLEKRNRLKSFDKIKETEVPKSVNAELRPYQLSGLNWLNFLDDFKWGGILADDMGLGKTLQMLTFLMQQKERGAGTSLVVVPTTLIFNWQSEVAKFCPDLNVLVHYSPDREKSHKHFGDYDVVLTTYGLLANDIKIISKFRFNYAILDESQAIKNTASQRYKAALLIKAESKLALTGTPIENNTFDLFAQMNFANPGFLGTAASFKRDYATAIDKNRDQKVAAELQRMINPFMLRRTKEEVATELPPKTEDVIYCTMEPEQRKVYDAYRNKYRDYLQGKVAEDGLEKSKLFVLEGLTKLRQICDSPRLIDEATDESIKIAELVRHIKNKTANHKIVVFSQFVSMLSLIRAQLDSEEIVYEYLDGQSSQKSRKESVDHFQTDESCRVFLISLKAGGTGLNLTAADYVYLVDPWWNPAVENQAIDRCYRIGQTKKVFAYRMICKDTIEEKIVRYQQRKKDVAADLIQTEQSFMKELTSEQLTDLFS